MKDELFVEAVNAVRTQGKASPSFLQRKLKVGYMRAALLLELMEEKGVIGPANGAKPREIL
jgi:DNA segregation ATPase FtsK/SpoIIIE, S-DNA-T family